MLFEPRVIVKSHAEQFYLFKVLFPRIRFGQYQYFNGGCVTTLVEISKRINSYLQILFIHVGKGIAREAKNTEIFDHSKTKS
ncbi:MAG: hypothetical protein H0V39_04550 [Nitrosomonas sp.]|nr:hypothetical protein [Nitrosomonas sp.]